MRIKIEYEKIPELLVSIFLVYIAIFDETIFNFISSNLLSNRIIITISTTLSAALPMFFAVGIFKNAIIPSSETIYYYEKLIHTKYFQVSTIVFFLLLTVIMFFQGRILYLSGKIIVIINFISILLLGLSIFRKPLM